MALPSMALGGFSQIADLIAKDPEALALKAAEAGLVPPLLEALGAIQAPKSQGISAPSRGVAPPARQPIASSIPDIMSLLSPQQSVQPASLGQLISGR